MVDKFSNESPSWKRAQWQWLNDLNPVSVCCLLCCSLCCTLIAVVLCAAFVSVCLAICMCWCAVKKLLTHLLYVKDKDFTFCLSLWSLHTKYCSEISSVAAILSVLLADGRLQHRHQPTVSSHVNLGRPSLLFKMAVVCHAACSHSHNEQFFRLVYWIGLWSHWA